MDLLPQLYACRPTLNSLDFGELVVNNADVQGELKGRIAEFFVKTWLRACEGVTFDSDLTYRTGKYDPRRTPNGVVIIQRKQTFYEYDELIFHKGRPYGVEIKALDLNGIEGKLQKGIDLGRDLYQREDFAILLFFPAYTNKVRDVERIQERFPQVCCIDSGYKKKQIENTMRRYPLAPTSPQPATT